ncbi:MAG: SRPBCC domain-containing protein [Emcibacteraceae bacterium]|nr:SRPBCC domain-containing protein [Emcibacteraceae bacterium]
MVERRNIKNPFVVKISREFNASNEKLFDAWLDSENLGNWLFGTPNGKGKVSKVDPSVGGNFEIGEMRGGAFANHVGTYHEIVRPSRVVFSYYYETENEELSSTVIVDIEQCENGCVVNITHEMDDIYSEYEALTIEGWTMIFNGLENYV